MGRIESSLNTVVQNTEENLEFSRATLEFSSATYEMLRSKTLPNSIWRCLLLFDYENQQREFDRFIQDNSVGACLVRSRARSAHPFLIHRFLTKIHYLRSVSPEKIDCDSPTQNSCIQKRICKHLELSEDSTIEKILEKITKKLETQSVVFILKNINKTTSDAIKQFILSFWQPLVKLCKQKKVAFDKKKKLVFILVEVYDVPNQWEWEVYCQGNDSESLYPLSPIEHLSSDEVRDNLEQFANNLEIFGGIPQCESSRVLLDKNSEQDNQAHEDIFKYIYKCYGLDWTDLEDRWKNHY